MVARSCQASARAISATPTEVELTLADRVVRARPTPSGRASVMSRDIGDIGDQPAWW